VHGIDVLLLDQYNYHQFQPLFYQVATAGLDASNISFPLRKLFQKSNNVRIRLAKVQSMDLLTNKLTTDIGEIDYDQLIIATGADTNFFGNKQLMEYTYPMKSTTEALQIRHHLLKNFEEVLTTQDALEKQRKMTIVVVGGGATGVEMSGAIAEMKIHNLPGDYPEIDFSQMQIILLEGGGETLGPMSVESQVQSKQYLEKLGVRVMLHSKLESYDGKTVVLVGGEKIETATVIWAAGIRGNVPTGIDTTLVVRGNRIKVDRHNRVLGQQNIFAIGDVASMETPAYPNGHPQLANVAINQGKVLAKNLKAMQIKSTQLQEFEYNDKGTMATVGRNLAVVDIPKPKLHFGGFIAWLIWMSLHLFLILGVKNRIQIFINWIYKYFTHDQSLRLLFKSYYRDERQRE
jgi:NADH dehydrogenase